MGVRVDGSQGAGALRRHRVLVVDDHPVFRRGMVALLEGEPWVECVLQAGTVREAVREAVTGAVNAVVMDVALPDGDGIEATARITAARPGVAVLVVTMTLDQSLVARALRAGARGYTLKDTDPEVLLDALRTVAQGGLVLGPGVGEQALAALGQAPLALPPPLDGLTPRELDILRRLGTGGTNAQIARALNLSEKTVRNQLSSIFAKIGVSDRVRAALLARDAGL